MATAKINKNALQHKHSPTVYHPKGQQGTGVSSWQSPTGYSRTGKGTGQPYKYTPPTKFAVGFKKPLTPSKVRSAVAEETAWPGLVPGFNDIYPTCSAVAVAAHLLYSADLAISDDQIWELHRLAGGTEDEGVPIEAVLEALKSFLLKGPWWQVKLRDFCRTDENVLVAGLLVGITLPHAGHAVLTTPRGMVSWGRLMPFSGEPDEAWALEWEAPAVSLAGLNRELG